MKAKISLPSLLLSAICCSDFCLVNGALRNYRFPVVTAKHIVPPWYQAQCPTGQLIFYFQIFILFHKVYTYQAGHFSGPIPGLPNGPRSQVPSPAHRTQVNTGPRELILLASSTSRLPSQYHPVGGGPPLPGVFSSFHYPTLQNVWKLAAY